MGWVFRSHACEHGQAAGLGRGASQRFPGGALSWAGPSEMPPTKGKTVSTVTRCRLPPREGATRSDEAAL